MMMSGIGADLKYIIGADTSKYDKAMDGVGSTAASVSSKIKLGMAGAAAAAGAAFVKMAADGVKSFAELERKMLRTESLIKATGNAAGLSADELLDFANQLDLATLNDRDAILSAINVMQTFRSVTGDTFQRSIELATDMAEVFGQDVRSATVQMGKALEDPIRGINALRRTGVDFTDVQKEMIKNFVETGEKAKAQGMILDTIAGQLGGAAKGAAGGLSGKVDTLNFRWRELKETLAETTGAAAATSTTIEKLSGVLEKLSKSMRGPQKSADDLKIKIEMLEVAYASTLKNVDRGFLYTEGRRQAALDRIAKELSDAQAELSKIEGEYVDLWQKKKAPVPVGADETASDIVKKTYATDFAMDAHILAKEAADKEIQIEQEKQAQLAELKQMALAAEWETKEAALASYIEQSNREIEIEKEKEAAKVAAQKAAAATMVQNTKMALAEFGKTNRAAFEAFKVVSIAEATVNTYKSAIGAYNAMVSIPYVGPALAVAAAAAATAYGMAQVAAISAMTPGAQGTAVGTTSAATTTTSNATGTGTTTAEPSYAAEKTRGNLIINIEGDMVGDEAYIDKLVEKINNAIEDRDVTLNT